MAPLNLFDCTSSLGLYSCKRCPFCFKTLVHLRKHIKEDHFFVKNGDYPFDYLTRSYICWYCSFETCSSLQWLQHVTVGCLKSRPQDKHTLYITSISNDSVKKFGAKLFQCKKCEYQTTQRRDFNEHFMMKHVAVVEYATEAEKHVPVIKHVVVSKFVAVKLKDKNWFQCKKCTYKTTHKTAFEHHLFRHNLVDKDKIWFDKYRLDSHKLFKCDKCTFKASSKRYLNFHMREEHIAGREEDGFKCDRCEFQATYKGYLKYHIQEKHNNEWFNCGKCAYKSKNKDDLKRHFLATHIEVKNGGDLIQTHFDDNRKWFRCDKCTYKCRRQNTLDNHLIAKHVDKDRKLLKCEKCSFKTFKKHRLTLHLNVKHHEFECEKCTHKSTSRRSLNSHILTEHTEGN